MWWTLVALWTDVLDFGGWWEPVLWKPGFWIIEQTVELYGHLELDQ